MLSQISIEILGLLLTGFSAITYRFFGTNVGKRWLDRAIERITEQYYTPNPHKSEQLAIQGLETLNPRNEDGILRQNNEAFDEVLQTIEDAPGLNPDINFEPFDPTDEIKRLESVERDRDDDDELKDRGIPIGRKYYLETVMKDGSRKIIDDVSRVRSHNRKRKKNLEKEKIKERRRFENRIEDGIKGSVILLGVVGLGLIGYSYL